MYLLSKYILLARWLNQFNSHLIHICTFHMKTLYFFIKLHFLPFLYIYLCGYCVNTIESICYKWTRESKANGWFRPPQYLRYYSKYIPWSKEPSGKTDYFLFYFIEFPSILEFVTLCGAGWLVLLITGSLSTWTSRLYKEYVQPEV